MPRNAANKEVLTINAGVTVKGRFGPNANASWRAVGITGRATNHMFDTDASFKFQSIPAGRDEIQRIVLAGTTLTGTFTISWNGMTTAAITWSATLGTFQTNVQTALDAMLAAQGYPAGSIVAVASSHSANGSTLNLRFTTPGTAPNVGAGLGARAWAGTTTARTVSTGGVGTTLTGGSPTATITVPTAGYGIGAGPASDVTADGKSSATLTVKPRATLGFSFGSDSDSENQLGPYFTIVGITGSALLEIEADDATINFLGNNA